MLLILISEHLFFKIFLGGHAPRPPSISMLCMLIVLCTIGPGPVHLYTRFSKFCRWSCFPHMYSSCLKDLPDQCKIASSTPEAVCAINKFVKNNNVLNVINLSGNAFSDNETIVLADGLIGCKNLQCLDLSNNRITDYSISNLLTAFLQMANFTLHFENNLGEKILKTAFDIIERLKKPLYSFVSSSNDEVNTFLILLSSAADILPSASLPVQNLIKIKRLNIKCSKFIKCTAETLSFFKMAVDLEELIINGLCIESKAINVIADTLTKSLCSLKVLNLTNCQLDSSKVVALLSPCKSAILPKLTKLNLSQNKINDDVICSVIESLLQIPNLSEVNFDGNPLSTSKCEPLALLLLLLTQK